MSAFYLEQVEGAPTHEGDLSLILGPETIGDPYSLGPIYIHGDFLNNNLFIESNPDGAVRLDGNIYVEGAVIIGQNTTIYMNNFTIYSNSSFSMNQGSTVVSGYGCMVANNSIALSPSFDPNSYIVAWSIENMTRILTLGEFNGPVLGYDEVYVSSGATINWSEPPPGLPLPPLPGEVFRIVGWESTSQ